MIKKEQRMKRQSDSRAGYLRGILLIAKKVKKKKKKDQTHWDVSKTRETQHTL